MDHASVIIDGTVPRTGRERIGRLLDYYLTLQPDDGEMKAAGWRADAEENGDWINEVEDEIVDAINAALPDGYVCVLGEPDPGDAVVRRIEDEPPLAVGDAERLRGDLL